MGLAVIPYAAWRWFPPLQRLIFPYLGGQWSGQLVFDGTNGSGTRDITMQVRHTISSIVLILESAESTSRTLVVQADRDALINRHRLYYVYANERKEGFPGAGSRYQGLAVLRVEPGTHPALHGNYFTEQSGSGTLHLTQQVRHPWWMLWQ